MATVLDNSFTSSSSIDQLWGNITNLEKLVPCVEGGTVLSAESPQSVRAEIKVKMGAMAMVFTGTVKITEQNAGSHRAVMQVKSAEKGGQGHANADVTFQLSGSGGTIHTSAQITGKAASMGEGAIVGVLDAMIKDFTGKLSRM
jgi:carbon monoxide dehydrogenase subunit G